MTSPTSKSVLIVLGMHRSGTSALAGLCHKLGVSMGETFLEPTPENPRGYFEDIECTALHNRILAYFGLTWNTLCQLPNGWQHLPGVAPFASELSELIAQRSTNPIWGIKDPRLCRLLPLWLNVLNKMGISPHFLISIRNPYEVAESLAHRDDIGLHSSLLLWFIHNLEAEYYTRSYPREIIQYPNTIEHWNDILDILNKRLHFPLPPLSDEIKKDVDNFLCSSLYRQRAPHHLTPLQQGFPLINNLWEVLKNSPLRQNEYDKLNQYWYESRLWLYAFTDWFEHIKQTPTGQIASTDEPSLLLRQAAHEKQEQLISLTHEYDFARYTIDLLQKNLYNIENSQSWRLTAPLRAMKKFVQKLL